MFFLLARTHTRTHTQKSEPWTATSYLAYFDWTNLFFVSFSCQLSEQLTDCCNCTQPICKQPTQSTYLIPILFLFTLLLFCTPVSLLTHHHLLIIICSSISPGLNLLNCNYFATGLFITIPPHAICTLYIDFLFFYYVIDCTLVYSMCNSVLCRTALLYLGQVAVVNENLFSTRLPG